MNDTSLPAEVALYRQEEEDGYRIGVSQRAVEHALGILRPGYDVRDHDGEWRIHDLETGAASEDIDGAVRAGQLTVLRDYPVTSLRSLLQDSLRNLVWSALIARLAVSGVRNPTDWRFAADHDELRLHDLEGRLRARIRYPNWWHVASLDRAVRLAGLVIGDTDLEALGVDELVARRREP